MWFVEAPFPPPPTFKIVFQRFFDPSYTWFEHPLHSKNNTIAFYPVDLFADSIAGPHVRDEMLAVAI